MASWKMAEPPKKKPPRLKVGKQYRFQRVNVNKGPSHGKASMAETKVTPPFIATVLEEFPAYWLLVTPGGYKTSITKNALVSDWDAQPYKKKNTGGSKK